MEPNGADPSGATPDPAGPADAPTEAILVEHRPRGPRYAAVGGLAVLLTAGGLVGAATRSDSKAPKPTTKVEAAVAPEPMLLPGPAEEIPTTTAPPPVEILAPPTTAAPKPAAAPKPVAPKPLPAPKVAPAPLTLTARLDQAMGTTPGCLMVEEAGTTIYERQPTTPFVPASSQKLMVAAAVLGRLGPDFRFVTKVMAPQAPGPDGRLENAWLVGGGDPYLAGPEYAAYTASKPRLVTLPITPMTALADSLVAAGVRDIPGGLQADESRHDTQRFVTSWKPSYRQEAEVGSFSALAVNEGLSSWGPSQAVSPNPAADATNLLTKLLGERGVTAAAPSPAAPDGPRQAPAEAVIVASVTSAPLADIVAATIRASDNFAAEILLRELDHATGGPGSTAGGAARVKEEMSAAGIDTAGVHLNDGSGLDTGNRATCKSLLGALALSTKPGLSAITDGLAVAGRSGTLANRFIGSPVEGRLAAKTGWLSGAAALVGRLDGAPAVAGATAQPTRRFAFLINGSFNFTFAAALEDKVANALASP